MRVRRLRVVGADVEPVWTVLVLLYAVIAISAVAVIRHDAQLAQDRRVQAAQNQAAIAAERVSGALERARTLLVATAQHPDVIGLADGELAPGSADAALGALSSLTGEASVASLIAHDNRELARVVIDEPVPEFELSPDESARPFLEAAAALPIGSIARTRPYLSPDTGQSAVSTVTPVAGESLAVLQVELALRPLVAGLGEVALVDADTGTLIVGTERDPGSVRLSAATIESTVRGGTTAWQLTLYGPRAGFLDDIEGVGTTLGTAGMLMLLLTLLGLRLLRLQRQARTDATTGLRNRRYFAAHLEAEVELAEGPVVVVVIDVARFRQVNDTLGHEHGDRLLREISRRLERAAPKDAEIARLGGAEFAMLLTGEDALDAEPKARQTIMSATSGLVLDGVPISIRMHAGLARTPQHGLDGHALLRRAALAVREGVAHHRDLTWYRDAMDAERRNVLALAGELEAAILADELSVVLQPKIDVETGRAVGLEALARWHRPSGAVAPSDFIPVAEATGLIEPLTLAVLDVALDELLHLHRLGYDLTIAVNLSARSLDDPDLPQQISAILLEKAILPQQLTLELTETSIMADPELALRTLQLLHDIGVRISVDDFGTGYSSMAYLTRLPVDEVKIDQTFVAELESGDPRVVNSVIQLTHELGLIAVAEGVESATALDRLGALQCDLAQGYHIGHPMTGRELRAWLARNRRDGERPRGSAAREAGDDGDGLTGSGDVVDPQESGVVTDR